MLTREQRVILTKIINAGVSKAGCVLSELIGCRVRMQVPIVGVTDFADLHACLGIQNDTQLVSVCQQFHGTMDGYALLLLSLENGNALAQRLIGDAADPSAVDLERSDTLEEAGNILTNSVLGTIANAVGHRFEYQVPVYREGTLPEIIAFSSCGANCSVGDSQTLYARAHFDFDEERVIGSVLILLTAGAFNTLLELVDNLHAKAEQSTR
jgi:chemotaxis protein CheC